MDADLDWSPYTYHFREIKVGANIRDKRGDAVSTSYRYTVAASETWYTRFNLRIMDNLLAYYSFESDLKTNRTIETRAGIAMTKACWGVGLEFKDSSADKSIAFLVTLRGIGEFGN